MASSTHTPLDASGKPISMSSWEQEDIQHFFECAALGVEDRFWTPEEELRSKQRKSVRRALKRGRREHNENVIRQTRKQVPLSSLHHGVCAGARMCAAAARGVRV